MPLDNSNVQVDCPRCDNPTRVAHAQLEGEEGRTVRVCKHCGEQVEVSR
jgi:large subunit ribosomal protein L24